MYQTNISDKRWIAYDIPGNIGWIMYITAFVRSLAEWNKAQWKERLLMMRPLLPAVLMLIGIAELISERIAGLDRVLSQRRLLRGFGALTLGGIFGTAEAAFLFTRRKKQKKSVKRQCFMFAGGLLCAIFGGLLLFGYRKMSAEEG